MESFLYFIFSLIISSSLTFGYIRYTKFTKRGIHNDIVKKHLNGIQKELEDLIQFPYKYFVGETSNFTESVIKKLIVKLRRRGFNVLRLTEDNCEILIIS